MSILNIITISMCLLFAFINGFHDGCNVVATIISSRSIKPKNALWIAGIAEFTGSMLLGTSVAITMGISIVNIDILKGSGPLVPSLLYFSAIIGAIVWNMITWWFKLPSSSSHALIGGIIGAGIAGCGIEGINFITLFNKVIIVLFTSPLIGFVIGYICLKIVVLITKNMHPRTNNYLKRIQVISMFALGMSHGSNDSQKTMGIIVTVMFFSGMLKSITVPLWVQAISAVMIALGLMSGGWRLVKTVGTRIFSVKPIHSFSSQVASAVTIISASVLGAPVSSTQIVNSSIAGVGAAERKNAVRWKMVKNILISWVITLPCSALIAFLVYMISNLFFK